MTQPCLVHLPVISLVALMAFSFVAPTATSRHVSPSALEVRGSGIRPAEQRKQQKPSSLCMNPRSVTVPPPR